MDDRSILILDAMEISLSLMLLGRKAWNGMPPLESDTPAEQRMSDAFLQLCRLGFLAPKDDGWERTPLLHAQFDPVAEPDTTLLLSQVGPQVCVYRKGDQCTVLEQIPNQPESCRVYSCSVPEVTALLQAHLRTHADFLEPEEGMEEPLPCTLQILNIDGALRRIFWLQLAAGEVLALEPAEASHVPEPVPVTDAWLDALILEDLS